MTMRSSRLWTSSASSLSFALTSESDRVFMRPALLTSFLVRSYQSAGAKRDSRTPLMPRLPAVERRQLGLLRQVIGGAKVAVALNEHAADHEHRVVRRRQLRRAARNRALPARPADQEVACVGSDRKSTRLNSSHSQISYAVFCLKKK